MLLVDQVTFCAVHTAAGLQRASVVAPTTAAQDDGLDLGIDARSRAHRNSCCSSGGRKHFRPPMFHAFECTREFRGTPRSKNSIWSARILRLLRMNASYRFGTYGT